MAADIVPIRLRLTKGDVYTLWAPRWRADGDEWEAFLGKDENLYVFNSVADLVAFVRTNSDNDIADHPAWEKLTEANAHRLDPAEDHTHDLAAFEELLATKATEESVSQLHGGLAVISSIGTVCELPSVTKFFNGNPILGSVGGGTEAFSGRAGRKRWADIEKIIARSWDKVIDAIDEIVTTPEVDSTAAEKAQAELDEPAPEDDVSDSTGVVIDDIVDTDEESDELAAAAEHAAGNGLPRDPQRRHHGGTRQRHRGPELRIQRGNNGGAERPRAREPSAQERSRRPVSRVGEGGG